MYINEAPEYKAKIEFINPETNQREVLDEIIGLNYFKYPVNSYVLCKYFQGDVNIISIVPESEVPSSIKKSLPVINTDIKYSDDKEYVNIDGINYKKVQ